VNNVYYSTEPNFYQKTKVGIMPIYEYECTQCSAKFEIIVSLTSNEIIQCEKCGSTETRKLISAASGIKVSPNSDETSGCQARGGFS
jgi:putative FmdB family regulatory protein